MLQPETNRIPMETAAVTKHNVQPRTNMRQNVLLVFDVIVLNLLVEVILSPACVASQAMLKRSVVRNLHLNAQVEQIQCPLIMEGFETFENDAIN